MAKLILIKMGRALYANQGGSNERALMVGIVPLLLFIVWGVRGAWAASAQRPFTLLFLAIVLYTWAMATLVLSIGRYLVPVTGLLFVLCGYTLARFVEHHVLPRLPTRLTRYLPR